jgi:GMP synthase (glutamine-hydrolysing)
MIIVMDFGSQYTHLIARRIREFQVFSQILFPDITLDELKEIHVEGIIFSGGPASIYEEGAPTIHRDVWEYILEKRIPILGICYGLHLLATLFGGKVLAGKKKEYGVADVEILGKEEIFSGLDSHESVWMSHGDSVAVIPHELSVIASSENCPITAFKHTQRDIYGLQWHPEVRHTVHGRKILENFIFNVCHAKPTWRISDFINESVKRIESEVGKGKAVIALSGGVDSSVACVLAHRALHDNLYAIFVDHGLLRKNEAEQVKNIFSRMGINLTIIDASRQFLGRLEGITDPEEKRKAVGEEFIRVFEREAVRLHAQFLIQGTIYPDVIESGTSRHSQIIKSHHNVGGLPANVSLKIVEPLRELYKDEVRVVGRNLGLPPEIIDQHPFPGPGLSVRIIGEITEEKIRICREASAIVEEELEREGISTWQAFAVVLDERVVGVVGDQRKFGRIVALRIVESDDAMTANFVKLPWDILERISTKITNELPEVVSVAYFVSNKPPQTIEPC